MTLCQFCGAYSPRSCDLIEDAGCCPWEEAEDEALSLTVQPEEERSDDDELG